MKTSVYTHETVFNESAEQPIDVDFTLGEYCGDIAKILKCKAVSRISQKSINAGSITVEGNVTITLIYCDTKNNLNSYEYRYPFSKTFETNFDTDGCFLKAWSRCEYINCRAVTPRKVDVHGAAVICVRMVHRKRTDVISDVDDKGIELLRSTAPATVPMGAADKYIIVEEEIELGAGQTDIQNIIRYDAAAVVKESKIIAGKCVVKGEIALTILYCSESASVQTVRSTIPFSQIIEVEGINDACESDAKAEICHLEIKPRTLSSGQTRSFSMTAKLLIDCECFCNNDVDVILDAYSRKNEAIIEKSEVCFNKIIRNINETFNCKKNLQFSDGDISVICDINCSVKSGLVKFENNKLTISGTVTSQIIALDCDSVPAFYEKTMDFTYSCNLGVDTENLRCEPQLSVTACNYTLTGSGNMEFRVDICVNAAIYECRRMPLITSVSIDEKRPIKCEASGSMTIYFASRGERLWDIARKYYADLNEIMEINDISEDVLQSEHTILVPRV